MLARMKKYLAVGAAALPLLGMGDLAVGQQQQKDQQSRQAQTQQERSGQGQQGQQSQQGRQGQQSQGQQGQQQVSDQELAQYLMISNQAEIELAQWAQENLQNEQVKQFAQKIVQDHQQFGQQLQQAAGGQVTRAFRGGQQGQQQEVQEERRELQQERQKQERQKQEVQEERRELQKEQQEFQKQQQQKQQQQSASSQQQSGMQSGWLRIKQELCDQMLQSTKEGLQNVEKQKMAEAFLSQQIFAHMQEKATLKVFQKHASSDLRQVLQQGEQHVEEHLQRADQLLQQIKQEGGQGGQQQGQQQQRRTFRQEQP